MPAKTSPELLVNLFQKFQRRAKAATGTKVSMRQVSEELLSQPAVPAIQPADKCPAEPGARLTRAPDVNALGRWTKPGTKRNWFIPVGRVVDVARQLGATVEERDALMLARLTEIAEHDPKHDILVCGAWVAERIREQHRLDTDEQAILDAFRKSRAVSPYSTLSPARLARLQGQFEEMAREHLAELALEQDMGADEGEVPAEALTDMRAKRAALMDTLRRTRAPGKKAAEVSAQVLVRRFLRTLRKSC